MRSRWGARGIHGFISVALLAVLASCTPESSGDPGSGGTWTRSVLGPAPGQFVGIASGTGPAGLLLGYGGGGSWLSLRLASRDGEWRRVDAPEKPSAPELSLDAIGAGPDGYVIAVHGRIRRPGTISTDPAPFLWFSPDGRTWRAIADDDLAGPAQVYDVVETRSGWIAAG